MDVTNEQAKIDVFPHPRNSSSPSDHVIPQMVITSADDVSREQKNVTECSLVLTPPSNGHSTEDALAESTDAAHSVSEETPDIDFEDISVAVRDVVSKCTETVSHSVRQRPLVIEKNVQDSDKDGSVAKCPPPPPPPLPSNVTPPPPPCSMTPPPPSSPGPPSLPTTMQRPLVFDGSASTKIEDSRLLQEDMSVNESSKIDDELICDTFKQESYPISPVETEPAKSSDPSKKEGLQHGVKKFFDSLLHHETTSDPSVHQNKWSFEIADVPSSVLEKGKSGAQCESPPQLNSPRENKESSSFAKEAKQSIKSFFDTFKHESGEQVDSRESIKLDLSSSVSETSAKHRPLSTSETTKDSKHSTSFTKDTKKNIKTFFDNLKQDPCEQKLKRDEGKKSVSQPNIAQEESQNEESFHPESPKEGKESFAKDTKQNIKAFFDTFKHETSEPKPKSRVSKKSEFQPETEKQEGSKNQCSTSPESPQTSQSFAKDTKQNIKAFFDTFKHESGEQKSKESAIKTSASQPIIICSQEVEHEANLQSSAAPESPKEPKESSSFVKDTKHNIKTFLDSFKHEPSDKQKDVCKKSHSQPDFTKEGIESSLSESTKIPKDKEGKKNVKSFFDALKPDTSSSKDESALKKSTDTSREGNLIVSSSESGDKQKDDFKKCHPQPDFTKEGVESSLPESTKIPKDKEGKKNVKSFFDTFKSETSSSKPESAHKKSMDTSREANLIVSSNETTKPNESTMESTSFAKDAKHNIKTFFDSFKHEGVETAKCKGILTNKETVSESDTQKELDIQHKDTSNPIKKLFSLKYSGDSGDAKFPKEAAKSSKETGKDKQPKMSKSVTLDLNPQYSSNGDGNHVELDNFFCIDEDGKEPVGETKSQAQPERKEESKKKLNLISSLKKTEVVSCGSLDSPEGKAGEHKGFKKFFDSFRHGKSEVHRGESQVDDDNVFKSKDIHAMDLAVESMTSKTSEKPKKEKKGKSIKRSLSDRVNREEVVQNFKGFFDSMSHKSSKNPSRDSEHIYDVVEIKSDKDINVPRVQIITDGKESGKSSVQSETQGLKKILSPFRSKDVSKQGSENTSIAQHPIIATIDDANKTIELPKSAEIPKASTTVDAAVVKENVGSRGTELEGTKHEKSSMFNAIGENILALKGKVMHTREKRKSEIIEESTELSHVSPKIEVEDPKTSKSVVCDQPSKESGKKTTPAPDKKKPAHHLPREDDTLPASENRMKIIEEPTSGPASLYNTCCIRLAVLLRDKAIDIAADRTKSPPPPKPPKPSAEAIARARAAAVSRRLEAQKMGRSVGENIPIGYDGIRFADDETESSCDYKDVENFDYIMDYELINRYKLDSSKFDTFSTDTGLSSYYTADTLTDIYSDAVMETVSLSSDISYSLKHLPSASRSEPKISTGFQEGKKFKVISKPLSTSKSPTTKKVPPPIPPKPTILQNISKVKGKPEDKTVSQCVNGLSLSPRLQNKFSSKDPAAAQKRPLMVAADVKGTQFSSLQHAKPKKVPPKPARNFETVLRNESLRGISCVTPPGSAAEQSNVVRVEKRTLSPPRPPPPVVAKKPDRLCKPDRPPPPAASTLSKLVTKKETEQQKPEEIEIELTEAEELTSTETAAVGGKKSSLLKPLPEANGEIENNTPPYVKEFDFPDNKVTEVFCEINLDTDKDSLNNNSVDVKKAIDDSLNNNILISESELPKRPPRNRRIRSRTVEIVPVERTEEGLKRSSSLSDIDVQKRVTFLNAEKSQDDAKSLYTKINKDGKRCNTEKISQSSPDLVSSRPLPAPPPPPRRFRSLERKGKSENINSESNITPKKEVEPSPEEKIRPPSRRRRKSDKQRFFSLHSEKRKDIDDYLKRSMSVPLKPSRRAKYDVNANISSISLPEENLSSPNIPKSGSSDSLTKSKSKDSTSPRKRSLSSWYDECDFLNESWEIVDAVPPSDTVNHTKGNPLVPLRRKSDGKRKSRETSKFYVNMDEEPAADKGDSSLPFVDESAPPLPPVHHGSSPVPLVDKETSPLPLDCSEKSVQTSLETLSQGIRSHDDDRESEDTDELLDLAQTLQKELSTIINRHKSVTESNEDTPSPPPLSAAASERNLVEDSKKVSSVRSSTSEVWPVTSSDESDVERAGEDSSNVNEVALRKKQKKIFYIAREIMTSEEAFVDALKLLNVDFKAAVDWAAKQKGVSVIPDDVLCQILNHLPQLQHLNENLLMELKDRIENWEKMQKIADIIVKMGPFLKLYSWYIHDFESNVSLLEDSKKKYPTFAQVVKEFEMSTRCKRLTLNHYMLKPIQRIPQYRLLLQEYLHHMPEDSQDYQDTVAALQIVSEVANHANDSMKQGDNAQKLISIQNSIMGHKEIVKPGRVFVREGELMKLSRKGMQPRWFVLFNDLLLYLTPVQQGLYRVNHELPLTGMKVAIPIQQDYQNEFSIISVTRSFTLAARSPEERQEWIIALTKAIEENASKRSTFTNSRLHQKAQDKTSSEDEGAFVLGKKAPVWIPDARVTMCQLCTSEFTVTFRRHHCRACGKVVCSICSSHRISLPYLGNRIARVCDECHLRLGQGSSACTESGETDSDNQQIAIKPHLRTDNRHIKKNKRSLPSVLKEVCANDQGSTISGYLHKKTGKSWKRDWFVIKDKVLYEYKASEDVAALRSTPLLGYQIEPFSEALEGIDASLLFQLSHPGQAPILFYADTVGSAERWVSALKTATVLE